MIINLVASRLLYFMVGDQFLQHLTHMTYLQNIHHDTHEKHIPDIYSADLQLNKTNTLDIETFSFLDLSIIVINN